MTREQAELLIQTLYRIQLSLERIADNIDPPEHEDGE
jgi:hypothetical protein